MLVEGPSPGQSRFAFAAGVLALALVVFGLEGYNLWRLRAVALENQLGSAAQYANAFEEHLTQTLGVVDVSLVTLGDQGVSVQALQGMIRNARYVRSISVVNSKGLIKASSEPRNVGIAFDGNDLLPQSTNPLPLLRIGPLTHGRDLYEARATAKGQDAPVQSFIAVQRDVPQAGGGFVTLVAVINPDYFLNYYGRNVDVELADVELLRLDGGLILSTAQHFSPGSTNNAVVMDLLSKAESGRVRDDAQSQRMRLSAYRVSKFFPIVAVVHLDPAKGLASWRAEALSTVATLLVVMLLATGMAVYYFLRSSHLSRERTAWVRALNNQKYALDQHAIVSITNPAGVITYANDRFCAISGYSRNELVGQHHRVVKSAHHTDSFFEALWQTISQGKVWHGEVCNRKKNGELYWVSATIVPLLGLDGFVQQYIAIRTDITQRKSIEESLRIARNAAEQASVAKSQFLANMSHEIRTPMNAILGMLQLLRRTVLTAQQQDYSAKTEGAARSLLGLLNDILDFSKAEAGKMALDYAPFRLDRLMDDVWVILSNNMSGKPVKLVLDVSPGVPLGLLGDDMRLRQILVNLGGNAVKFTETGEVRLQVRRLSSDVARARLEFSVSDTGIGIAPEHLAHIFDGFSQAESSTTRRFGGTGLGLAICQQLVRLMDGELQLRSTLGQGSTFFFQITLPVVEVAAPQPSQVQVKAINKEHKEQRLAGVRLLLVEDNKINQMVAQGLLGQEGADITLAENGALGVQAVADMQPAYDAVLMDIQMPVMDGFEATRAIRQNLGVTNLPIIAMTANAMASDREACLAAGMNDHVGKPFELDQLVATLQRHTGYVSATPQARATTRSADPEAYACAPGDLDMPGALDRVGGDKAMYAKILKAFSIEVVQVPERLRAQLHAHNPALAVRELHTLKGLAATAGARHLAIVAAALELRVKNGVQAYEQQELMDTLRHATHALANTLGPVLEQLQHTKVPQQPAVVPPLDRDKFVQDLRSLAALLVQSDMLALEAYALIRQTFGAYEELDLESLDQFMADLDFENALVACTALLQNPGLSV